MPALSSPARRADGYEIDTDFDRVDVDAVHRFLSEESYWSPGVPRAVVERSLRWSLCFGLYAPDAALAGFGRAVTDRAVFAYLADIFVLPEHRGRRLGVWLVETMLSHPEFSSVDTSSTSKDARRTSDWPRTGVAMFAQWYRAPVAARWASG